MHTTMWVWIVVAVIVALVAVAAAIWVNREQQAKRLRERFGPEYARTVNEYGSVHRAKPVLEARARRVEALHIHPLSPADAAQFVDAWRAVQAQFVDDPPGAITLADQLVTEVMQARGYPIGGFEQRAADISVDHPRVVQHYRAAHEVTLLRDRGEADTEDLRTAMVDYRRLFAELVETVEPKVEERVPAEMQRVPAEVR